MPELMAMDIFDSACGQVYLESETEVSYKPAELALYSDLVDTCNRVDAALEAEQAALVSALPSMSSKYQSCQATLVYNSLIARSTDSQLELAFGWKDEYTERGKQLNKKLEMTEPAAAAVAQRKIKREVDALKQSLAGALALVSQEACQKARELAQAASTARKAAEEGATATTATSKLDGIGSETWRALWSAARAYSTTEAYRDKPFPNVESQARCVLCHQELDAGATQRMTAFDAYITGALESAARLAEDGLKVALDALPNQPVEQALDTAAEAAHLSGDILAKVKAVWAEVQAVADALRANPLSEEITVANQTPSVIGDLAGFSEAVEAQAVAYDQAKEFNREQAEAALLELKARYWASQQMDAIKAEVVRLKKVGQYAEWRRKSQTGGLSHQAGRMSKALITDAYIDRFNDELNKLGAKGVCVELVKARVERGEVKHRIQLRGAQADGINIREILSEGERRIVSLAGFLADVTARSLSVPFVFDDPISSLDHEWSVATRLVELAQDRQVVVFTHRLSLYGGMEDAARKKGEAWKNANLLQCCIVSFLGTMGHPVNHSTWTANTRTANNKLLNERLVEARKAADAFDIQSYENQAQSICSDFRNLVERTIEEDLLSKVVLRNRRSITTEGRLPHLAKISDEDCIYFDGLMTKYSCYEHSQSQEAPVALPGEPDLRADIEGLKTWREDFKAR